MHRSIIPDPLESKQICFPSALGQGRVCEEHLPGLPLRVVQGYHLRFSVELARARGYSDGVKH
jgi:hypothetical protein